MNNTKFNIINKIAVINYRISLKAEWTDPHSGSEVDLAKIELFNYIIIELLLTKQCIVSLSVVMFRPRQLLNILRFYQVSYIWKICSELNFGYQKKR